MHFIMYTFTADMEGPDQTKQMLVLVWAVDAYISSKSALQFRNIQAHCERRGHRPRKIGNHAGLDHRGSSVNRLYRASKLICSIDTYTCTVYI